MGQTNENENYHKRKTKTTNLSKPYSYSNIVLTWRDTVMQNQTGFQFFDWKLSENSSVVPMISWLEANEHGHVNR